VYLNNAAVSFVMHGQDQYAAEACKAALHLAKSLVHNGDHNSDLSPSLTELTAQRLASLSFTNAPPCPNLDLTLCTVNGSLQSCDMQDLDGTKCVVMQIHNTMVDSLNHDGDHDGSGHSLEHGPCKMLCAVALSNFAVSQWRLDQCLLRTGSANAVADTAHRLLDMGLHALGVSQGTMMITEGNLMVAMAILSNQCCILECYDGKFKECQETILQELFLLQSIASDIVSVTCNFVPVAGAA
jgi:hypothetical protein